MKNTLRIIIGILLLFLLLQFLLLFSLIYHIAQIRDWPDFAFDKYGGLVRNSKESLPGKVVFMFANVMLNFYLLYVILRSIKYIELFKDDFLLYRPSYLLNASLGFRRILALFFLFYYLIILIQIIAGFFILGEIDTYFEGLESALIFSIPIFFIFILFVLVSVIRWIIQGFKRRKYCFPIYAALIT